MCFYKQNARQIFGICRAFCLNLNHKPNRPGTYLLV